MKNLLKWELKQTFNSKAFWGFMIAFISGTLLFALQDENVKTGLDSLLINCNNFNSLILLVIGIYSGIQVAGAFEERKIQAAVMAGNSRFNILISKLLSFSISVAIYAITSITISTVVEFMITSKSGIEGDFFREVILRGGAYVLAEVSFASLTFLVSMMVKNLGASITINLFVMILTNSLVESVINEKWAEPIIKYTPVGQTLLLITDASTSNLLTSVFASILFIIIIMIVVYIKFRKEELK